MKSKSAINRTLKELRAVVDKSHDPLEQEIAYIMETSILWATRKTVGWKPMSKEATEAAARLRAVMGEKP